MIMEIRTSDFRNKCGDCKFFKSENHIDGKCINLETKIRPWNRNRSYNSKSCIRKEKRTNRIYIFLDVDGVLNNSKYIEKCYEKNGHKAMHMYDVPFDPKCLDNLMLLSQTLEKYKYKVTIVLSSTWRCSDIGYCIVDARLAEYGLRLEGKTPYLGHRGKEIQYYLDNNIDYYDFLILDDDCYDIVDTYPDNLIQTKFNTGFNKKSLIEAIKKILGDDYNG